MERDNMVVMASWFNKFKSKLSEDQLKEVCYGIIQYGLWREKYESDDLSVDVVLSFIYEQIERMQDSYDFKVENSKKAGRPRTTNDVQIYNLARQGKTASEIAVELGIASDKTVYSTDGWKNRKNSDYLLEKSFEF